MSLSRQDIGTVSFKEDIVDVNATSALSDYKLD
jgi:hypothetical protein